MLLYHIFQAFGYGGNFLYFAERLPERFQRRLGLVPVRARNR